MSSRSVHHRRGPRGGITVFRSPKKPSGAEATPAVKPDLLLNAPRDSQTNPKNARIPSNVPTPESPVPRPRPIGKQKRPPPSPTPPRDRDRADSRASRPASARKTFRATANDDERERDGGQHATPKKQIGNRGKPETDGVDGIDASSRAPLDAPRSPGVSSPNATKKKKKKKKKGGDPEKAGQAAAYEAVNAARAAAAAADARALRGRLDAAHREKETESDLAEQTRAQLEMLLSERVKASMTIATLERERNAAEELIEHQNRAMDEAEATIERLREELRSVSGGREREDGSAEAAPDERKETG